MLVKGSIRRMTMQIIFSVLLVLCLYVGSVEAEEERNAAEASYERYDLIIDDAANLVSKYEEDSIREQMEQIRQEECHVIFYTTKLGTGYSAAEKCERYAAQRYGNEKTEPVILFLIDMENREIYLYCTGDVRYVVTNGECLTITDNVYRYASREDYAGCAKRAFAQAYTLVRGYQIKRPMKVINNLLIAVFLGFLGNYLYLKFARERYKKKYAANPDKFYGWRRMHVTSECSHVKTYHYTESDGSSGGSGGGFSGGSSGGSSGGGHSF